MASFDAFPGDVSVKLDGLPIEVPFERRSFCAIRSYLERLALQRQRLLCWINVDGQPVPLNQPLGSVEQFAVVEAETMALTDVPGQLIRGAFHQTAALRVRVQSAVELVLINEHGAARELWWSLSTALKEPLLTLSLVPDTACGPDNGRASLTQLRKWQLQQLGLVLEEIDQACDFGDATALSEALEQRALPWLEKLGESLELWQEAVDSTSDAAACGHQ